MDSKTYQEGVLKTESADFVAITQRVTVDKLRMLHAAMGLCTEAGEFMDMLKKHIFYGKPFDEVNAVEELGDLLWYMGVALDCLGITFEQVMRKNHDKLFTRYSKGKFNSEEATNRDLQKELAALGDTEKSNVEQK